MAERETNAGGAGLDFQAGPLDGNQMFGKTLE